MDIKNLFANLAGFYQEARKEKKQQQREQGKIKKAENKALKELEHKRKVEKEEELKQFQIEELYRLKEKKKENGTAVFRSINRLKAALIETGISLTDAVVTKTHIMIRAKNPIFVYLKDKEAHWFVVVNGVEVHSKTVKLLRQYLTNS